MITDNGEFKYIRKIYKEKRKVRLNDVHFYELCVSDDNSGNAWEDLRTSHPATSET